MMRGAESQRNCFFAAAGFFFEARQPGCNAARGIERQELILYVSG
jgi:hypothetical protein